MNQEEHVSTESVMKICRALHCDIGDIVEIAHPKSAIQIRNREMVDRADLTVCCIEHEKGGAWQTLQHAMEQGKTVTNLVNEDETINLL